LPGFVGISIGRNGARARARTRRPGARTRDDEPHLHACEFDDVLPDDALTAKRKPVFDLESHPVGVSGVSSVSAIRMKDDPSTEAHVVTPFG
jgi:hypothetical protein